MGDSMLSKTLSLYTFILGLILATLYDPKPFFGVTPQADPATLNTT